jgi:hypothetical protein
MLATNNIEAMDREFLYIIVKNIGSPIYIYRNSWEIIMQEASHRQNQSFEEEFRNNYSAVTDLNFDYPRPVPAMLHGIGMVLGAYAAFGIGAWTATAAGVNEAPTTLHAAGTSVALSFAADAFLLGAYRTTWANRLLNPLVVAPLVRVVTWLKRQAIGPAPG